MRSYFGILAAACVGLTGVGRASAGEAAARRADGPMRAAYMHIDQIVGKEPDAKAQRAALAKALDVFKASGLRVAMPYMKTTGGSALYESTVVPDRAYKDWDVLAAFMAEAHDRGIDVWPVICVVPSGGEKEPAGILLAHPEWALKDKNGKPIGFVSPCNREARKWMASMVGEVVAKYKPQGVLLDYLRFPSQTVQLDPEGAKQLEKIQLSVTGSGEGKGWLQTLKEGELTELAKMISQAARRTKPDIKLGLYTWGPQVTKDHNVSQKWPVWLAKGYIDLVDVSGYCYTDNFGKDYMKTFEDRMKKAVTLWKEAGRGELSMTLGVKTSHGQIHKVEEIGEYRRVAREAGIEGVSFFTWTYLQPYLEDAKKAGYLN